MRNGPRRTLRFPGAVAAASAFFLGAGAFLIGLGFGWLEPWLGGLDGGIRALTVVEGIFLLGLGLLPIALYAVARRGGPEPTVRLPRSRRVPPAPTNHGPSQLREVVR